MEAYGNYRVRNGNSIGDQRSSANNTEVARNTDNRLSTPGESRNGNISISNMTFLSGCGVFDWAHSMLMDDVHHGRIKFGSPNRLDIFSEDEIFDLIEEIKTSQKGMRDPERLQTVYSKSLETLQELMGVMNQSLLFQMIAKKYLELNLDNTIKLLVRCKQLL